MRHKRESALVWLFKRMLVLLVILSVFAVVWLRSGVVSLEYSLSSLQKEKAGLMKENKLLAADRANLMSFERFEKTADEGFVVPDRMKVVYVRKADDKTPRTVALNSGESYLSPARLLKKIMD
jgi:hypothetical protein